jgi:hypothetical protein
MSPFLQDKLWNLLINLVSFLIGGGLLLLIIEWRRHRREQRQWDREEARLEIDILRAEIDYGVWQITDKMPDKQKLKVYENQLLGSVHDYLILVSFVIRNTTNGELFLTSYGVEENAPPGGRIYRVYEQHTSNFLGSSDRDGTVLKPLGILARTILISRDIEIPQKMETAPTNARVYAEASGGVRVTKRVELEKVPLIRVAYTDEGELHLAAYVDQLQAAGLHARFETASILEESIDQEATSSETPIGEDEIPF